MYKRKMQETTRKNGVFVKQSNTSHHTHITESTPLWKHRNQARVQNLISRRASKQYMTNDEATSRNQKCKEGKKESEEIKRREKRKKIREKRERKTKRKKEEEWKGKKKYFPPTPPLPQPPRPPRVSPKHFKKNNESQRKSYHLSRLLPTVSLWLAVAAVI